MPHPSPTLHTLQVVYDPAAAEEFVSDYQCPILCKGWEDGFLRYAEAGLLAPALDKLGKLAAAAAATQVGHPKRTLLPHKPP